VAAALFVLVATVVFVPETRISAVAPPIVVVYSGTNLLQCYHSRAGTSASDFAQVRFLSSIHSLVFSVDYKLGTVAVSVPMKQTDSSGSQSAIVIAKTAHSALWAFVKVEVEAIDAHSGQVQFRGENLVESLLDSVSEAVRY
jgi:hypothetical protein